MKLLPKESKPGNTGWIEVICGSMFSGKTEELIRRLRRAKKDKQRVAIFKHAIDERYSNTDIVSHNGTSLPSVQVRTTDEILALTGDIDVIGIDEAHFFGHQLPAVCECLAADGKRVIVAGLDQDFQGRPFEPMPALLALAEYITKTLAVCVVCSNPANRSQRIAPGTERVLIGATEAYEARCRKCFVPESQPKAHRR